MRLYSLFLRTQEDARTHTPQFSSLQGTQKCPIHQRASIILHEQNYSVPDLSFLGRYAPQNEVKK